MMPEFLRSWLLSLSPGENEQLERWLDDAIAPEYDMMDVLDEAYLARCGRKRPKLPSPYRKPGGKT